VTAYPITTGTDLADVENALVSLLDGVIYPNGDGQPSAVTTTVRIGRGWPVASDLNADLANSIAVISVYPLPNMTSMCSRYRPDWTPLPSPPNTLSLLISANEATISGSVTIGAQRIGIRHSGVVYTYSIQLTDTPATIAAALAALVPGASATGPTITVPPAPDFAARIAGLTTCVKEVTRQKQVFQISLWCPSAELRDAIGRLVAPALTAEFIPLADGTSGFLTPGANSYDDKPEISNLWIRHLRVAVEYGTTQVKQFPQSLFGTSIQLGTAVPQTLIL
jgi:hypothetical protein